MARDDPPPPRSWIHKTGQVPPTPWPAITEADLERGYRNAATMPAPQTAATRRASPLRPGDRGGPLTRPLHGPRRVSGPIPVPTRLIVLAPSPDGIAPWLRWLRDRDWHIHVVGRAMFAHDPDRPDLPGLLVGFHVGDEPAPDWLRWLHVNRSRTRDERRNRSREATA